MIHRRARIDVRMGRSLQIGHEFRYRPDSSRWRVRQVHRQDCIVELVSLDHVLAARLPTGGIRATGIRRTIGFDELRSAYVFIARQPKQAA
jgi:hypothetical protein